jgi:hypothetical protein
MSVDLRERLDASFGEGPGHRPLEDRLAAGRRALRRRRRLVTFAAAFGLAALTLAPVVLRPATDEGGGIIPDPVPSPSTTAAPGHVHLLIAPPRYVHADTPPVLYLFGRMFRRDRGVDVLATYGEVDVAVHPQGGAIVRVGSRIRWVLVVGNEPERLDEQREAPYDYPAFMEWASSEFAVMSGRLALAATAPGRYAPPVPDEDSPAAYDGDLLVAKPGGTVVERIHHPRADRSAVPSCHDQAVRVHTSSGDWFVLGFDCPTQGALYSERAGVRAATLSSWLAQVQRVQGAFESVA